MGRREGLASVCLRDGRFVFSLILFPRTGCEDVCFGLCIAYVIYKAKERIESVERFLVRMDLKASMKYLNVSAVNGSLFSASSHFLVIPEASVSR